ncbi:uncharacterized protein LOC127009792 [Eriocheir sinensis]|uniref:uncharacterized protein LOC127009792 n=1 Tax=Eriocheir sinensis TaxID=95602 RepID=UPI0021C8D7A8|nr:uncharacterized protein LOC127009792 [Eriocheir sinensis]
MAFTQSDSLRLKLLRILETAGEVVLRYTLLCGTDVKPDYVPLHEYLKSLPYSSTANFNKMIKKYVREYPAGSADLDKVLKKQFNDTDLKQITSDSSCGAFDITLLHKIIKVACENVAEMNQDTWTKESSEMEYFVTKIKNNRNEVVHEKRSLSELEYLDKVKELDDLFSKALEATKVRYNRDDSELSMKKTEVRRTVDEIVKEHVSTEEIFQRSANQMLPYFKKETNKEIKERLGSAKLLSPLQFLSGAKNTQVDVNEIFTKIIIKEEGKAKKPIDHLKLMTLTQEGRSPASPHFIEIEGDAGSGKTTLLTFMFADWLKEEPHRRMEGLQHFDLLFWVVCRHETSSTLESFVGKALPVAFVKYRDLLLPLLKMCKILFVVDGLDEVIQSSRQLFADIMSHGKDCPTFTVVCTSRPEGLMGMEAKTPPYFHVSHMKIEGIAIEDRSEFVLRHVDHLSRCSGVPVDTDRIRQVLQQIGWREMFRLPLNLLFLSYMYMEEPQKLTTKITQTELYQDIRDWSVEKLHHRMAGRSQISLPKTKILNTLRVLYKVSLRELLHDNTYLSEESLTSVTSSCRTEGLPEGEVLSAFFCLRREVFRGKQSEKYSLPHKSMQEHFAAHHIIGCFDKHKQGDIRRVLQGFMQEQNLKLPRLRNLFCHILGILSNQDLEPKVMAMKEAVDLIHKSGVKDTEDWLTVLAETEAGHHAMRRITHHIRPRLWGLRRLFSWSPHVENLRVRDATVHVAAALLPLLPCKAIDIELEMDPIGVGDVLFPALANHTVNGLYLNHHCKHPHPADTSAHLLQQCPRYASFTHLHIPTERFGTQCNAACRNI